jgi:Fungal N-terminal domain of STAND proteins
MAEALSVTASIVAVLQLTSVAIKRINSWSKKSTTIQNLGRELESLHTVLLGLLESSKQQPKQLPALQYLNEPDGLFDQAQKTLEKLVNMLTDAGDVKKDADWTKRGRAALGWPIRENEIEEMLRCLERYKSSVLLAIGLDSLYRLFFSLALDGKAQLTCPATLDYRPRTGSA